MYFRFSRKLHFPVKRTFIAMLILLFTVSGCSIYEKKAKAVRNYPEGEEKRQSDYVLEGVTHFHYENGILKVLIEFKLGYYYKREDELEMFDCKFKYFNKAGDLVSHGKAESALLYSVKSRLIARGNVVVTSETNGATLKTDELEWDGDEEKFFTESEVEITSKKGDVITGRGMVADIALRFVKIKYNVRGRLVGKKL